MCHKLTAGQFEEFIQEIDLLVASRRVRNRRYRIYMPIFSSFLPNSAITRWELKCYLDFRTPELAELKKIYKQLVERLNHRFVTILMRTWSERKLGRMISNATRLEAVKSMWIGNHNVDFFFPALGGIPCKFRRRFKGLAIEVDGGIHNWEAKERKDSHKADYLSKLDIGVFSVANEDLNQKTVDSFINYLSSLKRTDSKTRDRTWRNVYLETIFHHATEEEMADLFGFHFDELGDWAPREWQVTSEWRGPWSRD